MNRTKISQDLPCDGFGNSEVELYSMLKCVDADTEMLKIAFLSSAPCVTNTDTRIYTEPYNDQTCSYMCSNTHISMQG